MVRDYLEAEWKEEKLFYSVKEIKAYSSDGN